MEFEEVKRLDRRHILHSWSVNETLDPLVIKDVEGVYIVDQNDRRMLDFSSQLKAVNIGHKHPKVIKAIQEHAERICYISPSFAHESRSRLARDLAEITPGDLDKIFFTLAGADANENAVKMARAYTKKHKILSYYRSYHGATYGAITLSGDPRRTPVEPGIPGVVRLLNPYCYRCPFRLSYPECDLHCAEHVAEVIAYETPETIAALLIEPIVGAGGILIPPDGYLQRVKAICEDNGILLIADEIMTGFGRSGKWFAVQHWGVVPDMITMAKGMTSAYLPMGAVALSQKIGAVLEKEMLYCGLTYSGHPLLCATAQATLQVYKEEDLVENSRRLGEVLKAELTKMQDRHPSVGDVRCLGLFGCLELVKDGKTKEPLVPYNAKGKQAVPSKEISKLLMQNGVYSPMRWMFLSVSPPLSITEEELRQGLEVIEQAIDYADSLTV
jgi:taurine--2-oxoglutarate transaminase